MTLFSLRICISIFLLAEVQSAAGIGCWVGASHIETSEPPLIILRQAPQDPLPTTNTAPNQEILLVLKARDENGEPVESAMVYLYAVNTVSSEGPRLVAVRETDFAGRIAITVAPGLYQIRLEKHGFFTFKTERVEIEKAENLEINLKHEQEIRESVDVSSAPPTIDPTRTVASDSLGAREIVNLPYPNNRDFRNLVAYLPRVNQDPTGQLHINGSSSYQIFYALDGFNITHPASGLLELRVSPDALRNIEIQSSRFSAEYGKAAGGVLNLTTGMGDDKYIVAATDFIPSVQFNQGLNLDSWTPRLAFSGPLRKGRAWFYSASDADVSLNISSDLPKGADKNLTWRLDELAKGQINLSPTNLVNVGFLMNKYNSANAGLSAITPLGTAPGLQQGAYLIDLKDQIFRANGLRIETGLAASRFTAATLPHGDLPYQLVPGSARGSYFLTSDVISSRLQGLINITLSPSQWRGRHEIKLGADIDHINYDRLLDRNPIQILRANNTLSSEIIFDGVSQTSRKNLEMGAYFQDRWSISNRLLFESGLRFDRDNIVRRLLAAPRLAASGLLTKNGDMRLIIGAGVFYDATNLDLLTRPMEGQRVETFFAPDGFTPLAAKSTEAAFIMNERRLEAPRSFGWSAEFERKLPAEIYFRAEWIGRRGVNGYTFELQGASQPNKLMSFLELGNTRKDRYDAFTLTARRAFKGNYLIFASYTRSSARTNAVIDYTLDTPIFSPQQGGPFAWDAPNRLISWGWTPLVKKFDLAYSVEWRSGYPFSVINQDQQLFEAANSRRFPDYFSLNLYAERRFRLARYNLALRAGFNNITNRKNATAVDNNIDSSQFLTFSGIQKRAFVARIRFLGRK
ncbi:MAG: TonB-dependent receptor [Chloracidobacterium sp.]|nr:TonB-dependent receptor [Chloracidobacterium sp.]